MKQNWRFVAVTSLLALIFEASATGIWKLCHGTAELIEPSYAQFGSNVPPMAMIIYGFANGWFIVSLSLTLWLFCCVSLWRNRPAGFTGWMCGLLMLWVGILGALLNMLARLFSELSGAQPGLSLWPLNIYQAGELSYYYAVLAWPLAFYYFFLITFILGLVHVWQWAGKRFWARIPESDGAITSGCGRQSKSEQ